jgi:hypothetical protein
MLTLIVIFYFYVISLFVILNIELNYNIYVIVTVAIAVTIIVIVTVIFTDGFFPNTAIVTVVNSIIGFVIRTFISDDIDIYNYNYIDIYIIIVDVINIFFAYIIIGGRFRAFATASGTATTTAGLIITACLRRFTWTWLGL